eukprot:scaffold84969_cov57-Phaeocystis_antarctica.AAC.1
MQAKKHGKRFSALVLIGVAAAFCAGVIPHITKPSVASKLAGAEHPVAYPPQWLPLLLATASTVDAALLNANARSVFNEPPPECANVTLATEGWQMLSFNCIGNMSNTFNVLEAVTWGIDDKIMSRDPFLKFATFNGDRFVGGLVDHDQLSMSRGYKIFYSGAEVAVFAQAGAPQLPVEDV